MKSHETTICFHHDPFGERFSDADVGIAALQEERLHFDAVYALLVEARNQWPGLRPPSLVGSHEEWARNGVVYDTNMADFNGFMVLTATGDSHVTCSNYWNYARIVCGVALQDSQNWWGNSHDPPRFIGGRTWSCSSFSLGGGFWLCCHRPSFFFFNRLCDHTPTTDVSSLESHVYF